MKRFLALLCTVCMIATMAPSVVMAEEAVIKSWDASAPLTLADNGFEITPKTMVDVEFLNEGLGGNSGSYMKFATVTDEVTRDEALIHSNGKLSYEAPYVGLSINVYGKALQDMYTRYTSNVKPNIASGINGVLEDDRWNNVFVSCDTVTKTTALYVNGKYIASQDFYEYVEKLGHAEDVETTVDRENDKWTYTKGDKTESGSFTMSDVRFKFVRNAKNSYVWHIDDINVMTSDSAIVPVECAEVTGDSDVAVNDSERIIKIKSDSAKLYAEGAKIVVNGVEGNEVKSGDKVVVITSAPYGDVYSAEYTVASMDAAEVAVYDATTLKKEYYTSNGAGMADLNDKWGLANINDDIAVGVTEPIGGKINDGYLRFSGSGELNINTISNKYSTRYFGLSINVYGQNLRDIWSRLAHAGNKVSLVAEGYKFGGHLQNSLLPDAWNNVFFVFDSQTKDAKTYINGKFFKSANLYTTVEKALNGTVDRVNGTATANEVDINASLMSLYNDVRLLFVNDGTAIKVDDIAVMYADYELAPETMVEVAVNGGSANAGYIFLDEGVETATVEVTDAPVLVDSGDGFVASNEIKVDDKVVVVNNTHYGTVYQTYVVTTPVYGTYESFGKADVKWSYANGILTIYGKGDMPAVTDDTYKSRPWQEYVNDITKIVIEEGITNIAAKSFMLVSNLREVVIPGTVTKIGGYAFQNCGKLDNVVFPEGVTTMDNYVFYNANGVKTITLPATFAPNTSYNFNNKADSITTINVPWYAIKAIAWAENYKNTKKPDAVINITDGGTDGYLSDTEGVAEAFRYSVDRVTGELAIEKTAVESNGKIQVFTDHMPGSTVELIAPWYYAGVGGAIKSVVVGEGITHIPSQMVRSNKETVKVTLPSTLASAGSYVFNAAKISELYIKEGASFVGVQMINDNCSVEKIIFPSTVTPAKDIIRDFTFGTRGNMASKSVTVIAPYASPAYAWAMARHAEATAQAEETKGEITKYWGALAENISINASYEITGNTAGAVTVVNNTGYAIDSVYVVVAYYDDASCTKLSAFKVSDKQTLAEASNVIAVDSYDGAAGKTVKVFLSNGLIQLKPMAAAFVE